MVCSHFNAQKNCDDGVFNKPGSSLNLEPSVSPPKESQRAVKHQSEPMNCEGCDLIFHSAELSCCNLPLSDIT
ncbi:hypothetical protein CRM22_005334 [Opisthorchis felineus]|uniref:Uncharacterized protein n=1 Tax=Opisthorchis felineus TaxID=147828 RepID=A0A4S2LXF6_OPIFE|nr:hypothetical protein CRM22_005334 [Opisthorchis felineus]